jgi:glycosyltransferase involved in cell wall biosynthesis
MMNDQAQKCVAVLLYGVYPYDGRVRRQSELLANMGFCVDVIALREEGLKSTYVLNGVTVHQLPLQRRRGGALCYCGQYLLFLLLGFVALTWMFTRKRYKFVHVNNMPDIIVFCALIPRLFGAKIILDIHDPFPELFSLKLRGSMVRRFYPLLKFEERISTAFVDHIITTTDQIATTLAIRGVPPEKITVVMNTPDPELFDPNLYPGCHAAPIHETFVILFAGTVVERNGLDSVVRMLPHLRDRLAHVRFKIIGTGDYIDELVALIDELKVRDMVEMQPLMPVDAIPREFLQSHAVFWFPERNPFIDIVMSTKVLEALRMGVPVITTRTPCLEHYFPNDEITFVDTCDEATLVTAMLELYHHYEARRPTAQQTEAFRQRFAWEKGESDYGRLINLLCGCGNVTDAWPNLE